MTQWISVKAAQTRTEYGFRKQKPCKTSKQALGCGHASACNHFSLMCAHRNTIQPGQLQTISRFSRTLCLKGMEWEVIEQDTPPLDFMNVHWYLHTCGHTLYTGTYMYMHKERKYVIAIFCIAHLVRQISNSWVNTDLFRIQYSVSLSLFLHLFYHLITYSQLVLIFKCMIYVYYLVVITNFKLSPMSISDNHTFYFMT